jgi:hypothetical protein
MKKIFLCVIAFLTVFSLSVNAMAYSKEELTELINECETKLPYAYSMAEACEGLGYSEDHLVSVIASQEIFNLESSLKAYRKEYNEIIEEEKKEAELKSIQKKKDEYPVATTIWYYLKGQGYNNYVAAGILGNIMAEVGGQSLDIQPSLSNNSYYGMCQWSKKYYPQANGLSLGGQCEFLTSTIEYEFNTYGYKYQSGFNYSQFLTLDNERAASLAFAKCYERCGSGSYSVRQNNATKALEYFTS